MAPPIRVVLADDQALVRAGFRALLDAQHDIEVVGEAGDGDEAVGSRGVSPDVVLMDIRMPGTDGLAATRAIAGTNAPPRQDRRCSPRSASTSTCSRPSGRGRAGSWSRTRSRTSSCRRCASSPVLRPPLAERHEAAARRVREPREGADPGHRPRGPHRPRTRDRRARRRGAVEPGDRRAAVREPGDREDPRQPGDGEAPRQRPGPAGRDRLRVRARPARLAGLSVTAELQTRVDAALRRAGRRPGLLVASATDGDDTAFASRGPLPDPPCAPERAVFEIGSITKVFTSLLLAIAAERGELGVDDPLVEHLPRGTRVPMRDGRPIRLVDLATHRSGLPRLPPGFLLHALRHRDDPYARLSTDDPPAAPGRRVRESPPASDSATRTTARGCWASRSPTRQRPTTKPWCGSGSPRPSVCGTP